MLKKGIFAQMRLMKTMITIVRHGETEWNVAMRLQGKQDSPLTETGLLQAEKVAAALKSRTFDALVSSDLGRAIKTAETINKYHQLEIIRKAEFRERNFGVMEGLTLTQVSEKYPELHGNYKTRQENYHVPEGESLVEFSERVKEGFASLAETYAGKRILVVAHGGVLDCIFRMIFDLPLGTSRKFSIYNTSINNISWANDRWKLEEWGNIDHINLIEKPYDELNYIN
jgi:probable phosphoglycerate mutase